MNREPEGRTSEMAFERVQYGMWLGIASLKALGMRVAEADPPTPTTSLQGIPLKLQWK
jgi:hypothetical protein